MTDGIQPGNGERGNGRKGVRGTSERNEGGKGEVNQWPTREKKSPKGIPWGVNKGEREGYLLPAMAERRSNRVNRKHKAR